MNLTLEMVIDFVVVGVVLLTFVFQIIKRSMNRHKRTEEHLKEWANQQFAARSEISEMKEAIVKLQTKIDYKC